jgi:hypothetical protein
MLPAMVNFSPMCALLVQVGVLFFIAFCTVDIAGENMAALSSPTMSIGVTDRGHGDTILRLGECCYGELPNATG